MLRGIDANPIIAGGYADKRAGGICPMLAAHRNGGRTNLASFARAWDRFTGARRPRLATGRELRALRSYIELSLLEDEQPDSLTELARRIRRERPTRSAQRRRRTRLGAWLVPTRRYDVFTERVVAAHEQVSMGAPPPRSTYGGRPPRAARPLTSRRRRAESIPSG